VYGSFGYYVILAGTVQSLSDQDRPLNATDEFRSPTPEFNESGSLVSSQHFNLMLYTCYDFATQRET